MPAGMLTVIMMMMMTATITNNYGDDSQHVDDSDENEYDEDVDDTAISN